MAKDKVRENRIIAVLKNSLFITPKQIKKEKDTNKYFIGLEPLNKSIKQAIYVIYLKISFRDGKWRGEIDSQRINIDDDRPVIIYKQVDKLIKEVLSSILKDKNIQTIAPMMTVPKEYKKHLKIYNLT